MNIYYPDHENKRLWILMPKVASTSIGSTLGAEQRITKEEALEFSDYYTIAFVRHPFDRIVSALYKNHYDLGSFEERVFKWITWPGSEDRMDMHTRPQSWFLDGFNVDFLGRYENLAADWSTLQSKFKLPDLKFVIGTKGTARPKSWTDVDFDWGLLLKMYAADFALCPEYQ